MRTCPRPLPPLRQRLVEDLPMRTYAEPTMRAPLHGVADVARPFRTSPAPLGPEQVRADPLSLVPDTQLAWPPVVPTVWALRGLDRGTGGRPTRLDSLPHPRRPCTLPTLLSPAAVGVLLTPPRTLKHRAILTTLAATGLRVAARCPGQGTDSDSARMVLRGRPSTGHQERYVRRSLTLLPW